MHVRKSPGNDQGMCEFEVLESRITEVGDQLYTPDGGLHALSMRAWRRTLFTLVASRSRYFPISRVSLAAPGKISISRSMIVAARDRRSFFPCTTRLIRRPTKARVRAGSPAVWILQRQSFCENFFSKDLFHFWRFVYLFIYFFGFLSLKIYPFICLKIYARCVLFTINFHRAILLKDARKEMQWREIFEVSKIFF